MVFYETRYSTQEVGDMDDIYDFVFSLYEADEDYLIEEIDGSYGSVKLPILGSVSLGRNY